VDLTQGRWREGGYATFPGESVSIPTLTIPWGRVAPSKGGVCSAYKPQTPRHLFGGDPSTGALQVLYSKILTGEDMAILCGAYQEIHEDSGVLAES